MYMYKNEEILKSRDDLFDGILRLTVCMTDPGRTKSHGSLTPRTTSSGILPLAKCYCIQATYHQFSPPPGQFNTVLSPEVNIERA